MAEKKSVWLVTDGDYSEYHVVGIFSTEEKARRFVELFGGHWDEEELDPFTREIRAGVVAYQIRMAEDGDVISIYATGLPEEHSPVFFHYNDEYTGTIHAKSEKHAIKIANDKRRALIADPTIEFA